MVAFGSGGTGFDGPPPGTGGGLGNPVPPAGVRPSMFGAGKGNVFEWIFRVRDLASSQLKNISKYASMASNWMAKVAGTSVSAITKVAGGLRSFASSAFGKIKSGFASFIPSLHEIMQAPSELANIYLGLGINVEKGTREMANAYNLMGKLEFQLGLTADEAKGLVNMGHDLALFGKNLQEWAIASTEYAKATDQSVQSVGKLYFQLHRLYGLGTNQLRGLGAAMKYIGDKTAITHDELTGYVSGLDGFFTRLPPQSAKARQTLTSDPGPLAGAMADDLGDPQKLTSIFENMMNPMSPEGARMRSVMGMFGGMLSDEVLSGLQTDPADVIAKFAGGIGKLSREQLAMQAPFLQEVFGFSFKDLRAFQEMSNRAERGQITLKQLVQRTRAEWDKETRSKEKAAEVTNWYEKQQESFRRTMLQVWAEVGRPLMKFTMAFMKPLIAALREMAGVLGATTGGKAVTGWFEEFGGQVGELVGRGLKGLANWFRDSWEGRILPALETGFEVVSGLFKVLTWIAEKIPWKFLADNIGLIAVGFGAWKLAGFIGSLNVANGIMSSWVGAKGLIGLIGAGLMGWTLGEKLAEAKIGHRELSADVLAEDVLGAKGGSEWMMKEYVKEFQRYNEKVLQKGGAPVLFTEFMEGFKPQWSKNPIMVDFVNLMDAIEKKSAGLTTEKNVVTKMGERFRKGSYGLFGSEMTDFGLAAAGAYQKRLGEAKQAMQVGGMSLPVEGEAFSESKDLGGRWSMPAMASAQANALSTLLPDTVVFDQMIEKADVQNTIGAAHTKLLTDIRDALKGKPASTFVEAQVGR